MALFLLTLLAVDISVERILTKERIATGGLAIVLLILPYAQKIKGFGLEWEKGVMALLLYSLILDNVIGVSKSADRYFNMNKIIFASRRNTFFTL